MITGKEGVGKTKLPSGGQGVQGGRVRVWPPWNKNWDDWSN